MSTVSISEALFIEQDGNQFNDLWLAMAVIFGVLIGFFLGVAILFIIRRNFPAMYTKVSGYIDGADWGYTYSIEDGYA